MPHDPTLNPTDILAALGVADVNAIQAVHGGFDTSIWQVEHGSQTSALRVFRAEQAAVCQREIAAMELAQQAHVPAPQIRMHGTWQNRPALLMSWSPGIPLWQAIREHPERAYSLGKAFGRMQAQIHQAALPAAWIQQQHDWIAWAGPGVPQLATALQQRARTLPALLHLDYHPQNVLTNGREITAVLDWANAHAGDPRADVARTYTILMVEPYMPGKQPFVISLMRRILAWSWRRGYEQVAGRLVDMPWFYAWAGAVMARDLAPRVSDPQSWWQAHHLAAIQEWTSRQQQRAERSG